MTDDETLNPYEARQRVLDLACQKCTQPPSPFIEAVDELIRVSQKVAVRDAIGAIRAEFDSLLND